MALMLESCVLNNKKTDATPTYRYLFPYHEGEPLPDMANHIRGLTYITAERVGPREVYSLT